MNNKLIIPAILFSFLTLTACGGSGGGDTSDGSVNFSAAARVNFSTIDTNEVAAEGAGSTASANVGSSAKGGSSSSHKTNSRIVSLISKITSKSKQRNKTVSNGVQNCAISGTKVTSYDDQTFLISATYNQCSEYGEITNGSLNGSFEDQSVSTVITMTFSNFTIVSASLINTFSMSMNGKMVITETDFGSFERSAINGSNMVISMNYSGHSVSLGNFIMTYDDYSSQTPSYDVSTFEYDLNSTNLGGGLHVESIGNVYQYYADEYPYSGKIKISGANNAAILISIIDSTNITVEKDIDGDGTFETSSTITWTELKAFL